MSKNDEISARDEFWEISAKLWKRGGYFLLTPWVGANLFTGGLATEILRSTRDLDKPSGVKLIRHLEEGESAFVTPNAIIKNSAGKPVDVRQDYYTIPENSGVKITKGRTRWIIDMNGNEEE